MKFPLIHSFTKLTYAESSTLGQNNGKHKVEIATHWCKANSTHRSDFSVDFRDEGRVIPGACVIEQRCLGPAAQVLWQIVSRNPIQQCRNVVLGAHL